MGQVFFSAPKFAAMSKLPPLNLPIAPLQLVRREGQLLVWDNIRHKYLILSPEEWVRQHIIHYLQTTCGVPKSAFALETGLKLHQKLKRSDILVHKKARPTLLVECKAPQVKIVQASFDQAARYNQVYACPLIMLSNGLEHYYAKVNSERAAYQFLEALPPYSTW